MFWGCSLAVLSGLLLVGWFIFETTWRPLRTSKTPDCLLGLVELGLYSITWREVWAWDRQECLGSSPSNHLSAPKELLEDKWILTPPSQIASYCSVYTLGAYVPLRANQYIYPWYIKCMQTQPVSRPRLARNFYHVFVGDWCLASVYPPCYLEQLQGHHVFPDTMQLYNWNVSMSSLFINLWYSPS